MNRLFPAAVLLLAVFATITALHRTVVGVRVLQDLDRSGF